MKDAEVVKTEASFFAPKRKEVVPMIVLKDVIVKLFYNYHTEKCQTLLRKDNCQKTRETSERR